jgi:hypothetical protein
MDPKSSIIDHQRSYYYNGTYDDPISDDQPKPPPMLPHGDDINAIPPRRNIRYFTSNTKWSERRKNRQNKRLKRTPLTATTVNVGAESAETTVSRKINDTTTDRTDATESSPVASTTNRNDTNDATKALPASELPEGFPEDLAFRALAAYATLRTLSVQLRLSPFTPIAFLRAIYFPCPNRLLGSVHVHILRVLLHNLDMGYNWKDATTVQPPLNVTKKRSIDSIKWPLRAGDNLQFLDMYTWPLFYDDYCHLTADVIYASLHDVRDHVEARSLYLMDIVDKTTSSQQSNDRTDDTVSPSSTTTQVQQYRDDYLDADAQDIIVLIDSDEEYKIEEEDDDEDDEDDDEEYYEAKVKKKKTQKAKHPPPNHKSLPKQLEHTATTITTSDTTAKHPTFGHLPQQQHQYQPTVSNLRATQQPNHLPQHAINHHQMPMLPFQNHPVMGHLHGSQHPFYNRTMAVHPGNPAMMHGPRPVYQHYLQLQMAQQQRYMMERSRSTHSLQDPNHRHQYPANAIPHRPPERDNFVTRDELFAQKPCNDRNESSTHANFQKASDESSKMNESNNSAPSEESKVDIVSAIRPRPLRETSKSGFFAGSKELHFFEQRYGSSMSPNSPTSRDTDDSDLHERNSKRSRIDYLHQESTSKQTTQNNSNDDIAFPKDYSRRPSIDTALVSNSLSNVPRHLDMGQNLMPPSCRPPGSDNHLQLKARETSRRGDSNNVSTICPPSPIRRSDSKIDEDNNDDVRETVPIGQAEILTQRNENDIYVLTRDQQQSNPPRPKPGEEVNNVVMVPVYQFRGSIEANGRPILQSSNHRQNPEDAVRSFVPRGMSLSQVDHKGNDHCKLESRVNESTETLSHTSSVFTKSSHKHPAPTQQQCIIEIDSDSDDQGLSETHVKADTVIDNAAGNRCHTTDIKGADRSSLKMNAVAKSSSTIHNGESAAPTKVGLPSMPNIANKVNEDRRHSALNKPLPIGSSIHGVLAGSSNGKPITASTVNQSESTSVLTLNTSETINRCAKSVHSTSSSNAAADQLLAFIRGRPKPIDATLIAYNETISDVTVDDSVIFPVNEMSHWSQFQPLQVMRVGTPYHALSIEDKLIIIESLIDELLSVEWIAAEFTSRHNAHALINLPYGPKPSDAEMAAVKAADGEHHDELCKVCNEIGDVVCCDGCVAVYHGECAGFMGADTLPEVWYCPECTVRDPSSFGPLRATKKSEVNWFTPKEITAADGTRCEAMTAAICTFANSTTRLLAIHGFVFCQDEATVVGESFNVTSAPQQIVLNTKKLQDMMQLFGRSFCSKWPLEQIPVKSAILWHLQGLPEVNYFAANDSYDPIHYINKYRRAPILLEGLRRPKGSSTSEERILNELSTSYNLSDRINTNVSKDKSIVESIISNPAIFDSQLVMKIHLIKLEKYLSKASLLDEFWSVQEMDDSKLSWKQSIKACTTVRGMRRLLLKLVDATHHRAFLKCWCNSIRISFKVKETAPERRDQSLVLISKTFTLQDETLRRYWERSRLCHLPNLLSKTSRYLRRIGQSSGPIMATKSHKRKCVTQKSIPSASQFPNTEISKVKLSTKDDDDKEIQLPCRNNSNGTDALPLSVAQIDGQLEHQIHRRVKAFLEKSKQSVYNEKHWPAEKSKESVQHEKHWPVAGKLLFDPQGHIPGSSMRYLGRNGGALHAPFVDYETLHEVGQIAYFHVWRKYVLLSTQFEHLIYLTRILESHLCHQVSPSFVPSNRVDWFNLISSAPSFRP